VTEIGPVYTKPVKCSATFTHMAILAALVENNGQAIQVDLYDDGSFYFEAVTIEPYSGPPVKIEQPKRITLSAFGKSGVEPELLRQAFGWLAGKLADGERLNRRSDDAVTRIAEIADPLEALMARAAGDQDLTWAVNEIIRLRAILRGEGIALVNEWQP